MKIKTSELEGAALDWAVATALGYTRTTIHTVEVGKRVSKPAPWGFWDEVDGDTSRDGTFHPSSNWLQGGQIIEEEGISLAAPYPLHEHWTAMKHFAAHKMDGPTPLIAAMRCYCSAKLGDEIDISEELCQQQRS